MDLWRLVGWLFIATLLGIGFLSVRANWAIFRHGSDNEHTQLRIRQALVATSIFLVAFEFLLLLKHSWDALLLPICALAVFTFARYRRTT